MKYYNEAELSELGIVVMPGRYLVNLNPLVIYEQDSTPLPGMLEAGALQESERRGLRGETPLGCLPLRYP
ncbi:hypothetical protein [Alkalispirochaeta alkalica]|uniref:hypothetical protein n=1 Tax=Alkalispirochaeta alkalica TaxID=46356 RepID=UPI00036E24BA|nr:hypothetical protein [Alkalispirochaeta alkalica]